MADKAEPRRCLHAVIVGGSVGGLACAVALRNKIEGLRVTVLERSTSMRLGGAGIGLNATSISLLQSWGLDTMALTLPMPIEVVRTSQGTPLHRDEAYNFRSAHWQDIYLRLLTKLPSKIVRLGEAVVGIEWRELKDAAEEGCVSVTLQDGKKLICDFVVACDGVASSMRGLLLPEVLSKEKKEVEKEEEEDNERKKSAVLRYCGYAAWRGVVEESQLDRSLQERLHERYPELGQCLYFELSDFPPDGGHNVIYKVPGGKINWLWYLPRPSPRRGIAQIDVSAEEIASLHRKADEVWQDKDSSAAGHHDHHHPFAMLVRSTASPFLNFIYDRDPLPSYVSENGLGVLCGDAAHPTSPHFLRSTNMAIADAATLAECLRESISSAGRHPCHAIPEGLRAYERKRLDMTRQEVLFARFLGQLKQGYLQPKRFTEQTPQEQRAALGQNHFSSNRWQSRVIMDAL